MSALGRSTGLSHPGRRRRHNEDAWVCDPPLFAIADGMGGARAGEIASRVAATALGEQVDGHGEARVEALIQAANRRVYERSNEDSSTSGMGTTITVALVEDGTVAIGHVGDSRAYLVRDRKLEQLTEDHSLVAELVRSGRLSPEEAESHPQRSVITRAIGTDPGILETVERSRDDLDAAAKELVGLANRSGGEDNITVVFFELVEEGAERPADTKPMPAIDGEPGEEPDEDTLSGLEKVPAVETMVVPPEQAGEAAEKPRAEVEPPPEPKEHLSVQAARVVVSLAVIAALLLLVYWLFGQSQ